MPGAPAVNDRVEAAAAAPHTAADVQLRGPLLAHTLLDVLFLRSLPAIVSVFTAVDGAVVYQNEASHQFYGDRLKGGSAPQQHQGYHMRAPSASTLLLPQLFAGDLQKLEQLLVATVANGGVWEGLVRVPLTLNTAASATSPWPSISINPLPYNTAVAAAAGTGTRAASSGGGAAAASAQPGAAAAGVGGAVWHNGTTVVCSVGESLLPTGLQCSNSGEAASITAAAPAAVSQDESCDGARGLDAPMVAAGNADATDGPGAASQSPPLAQLQPHPQPQLHPQPQSGLRPIQEHDLSSTSQDGAGLSATIAMPRDMSAALDVRADGRGFGAVSEHDYVLIDEEEKAREDNGEQQANGSILALSMSRRPDAMGLASSAARSGSTSLRGDSMKPSGAQVRVPPAEPATAQQAPPQAAGVALGSLAAAGTPAAGGLSGYASATVSAGGPTAAAAAAAAAATASAGGTAAVAMAMVSNGSWSSSVTATAASAAATRRVRLHEGSSCGSVDSVAAAMAALTASSNLAPPSVGPNSSARGTRVNHAGLLLNPTGAAAVARANTVSGDLHADNSRQPRRTTSTLRPGAAAPVPAGARIDATTATSTTAGGGARSFTAAATGSPAAAAAAAAEDDTGSAGNRVERALRVLLRRNSDTLKLSHTGPAATTTSGMSFSGAAMTTTAVDMSPHGTACGSHRTSRATADAVAAEHDSSANAAFADDDGGGDSKRRASRRASGAASASLARRITSGIARFVTTAVGGGGGRGSKTAEAPTVGSSSSRQHRSGSATPMAMEAADVGRGDSSSSRAATLTGARAGGANAGAARGRAAFTSPVAVEEFRSQQESAAVMREDDLSVGADLDMILRAYRSYSVSNMARPRAFVAADTLAGVDEEPLSRAERQGALLQGFAAGRATHHSFSVGSPAGGTASGSYRDGAAFSGMTGGGATGSANVAAAVAASGLTRQTSRVGGGGGGRPPARSARQALFKSVDPLATSSWQVLYDASSVQSSVVPSSVSQANGSNNAGGAGPMGKRTQQQASQPPPPAGRPPRSTESNQAMAAASTAADVERVVSPPRALNRSPSQQLLQAAAHSPAGSARRHSVLASCAAQDSGASTDAAFMQAGASSPAGAPSPLATSGTGMAAAPAMAQLTRAKTQPSLKRAQTAGPLSTPREEHGEQDQDAQDAAGTGGGLAAPDVLMAVPNEGAAAQRTHESMGFIPAASVAAGALAARGSTGVGRVAGHALSLQQARGSADTPSSTRARTATPPLGAAVVAAMYGSGGHGHGGSGLHQAHPHIDDGDPLGMGTSCGAMANSQVHVRSPVVSQGANSLLGFGSTANRPASRVLQFASTLSRYPAASSLGLASPQSTFVPAHLATGGASGTTAGSTGQGRTLGGIIQQAQQQQQHPLQGGLASHSPTHLSPPSSWQHPQLPNTGLWPERVPSTRSQPQPHVQAAGSGTTAAEMTPGVTFARGSSGGGNKWQRPQPPAAAMLAGRLSVSAKTLPTSAAAAAAGTAAAPGSRSWEDVAVHAAAAAHRCSVVPEDVERARPTMDIRSEVKSTVASAVRDGVTRGSGSGDSSDGDTAGAGGIEELREDSSNELLHQLLLRPPLAAAAPSVIGGSGSVAEQQTQLWRSAGVPSARGAASQPAAAAFDLSPAAAHASPAPAAAADAAPPASSARGGASRRGAAGAPDASQRVSSVAPPWLPGAGAGQEALAWHEVRAVCVEDPTTGERLLVVMQKDVTAKVEAERHIAQVSEAEHRLLEQIFPRHVLAYMTEEAYDPTAHMAELQQQQQLLDEEELHSSAAEQPLLDMHGSPQDGQEAQEAQEAQGTGKLPAVRPAGHGQNPAGARAERARRASALALMSWRPQVRDCTRLATWHDRVTVLFADIQGFTPMCKVLPPTVVMRFLNDLFVRFDAQLDVHGVYKVETIGDCYVVAGGLMHEDADGFAAVQGAGVDASQADKVFAFARAMLRSASRVRLPTTGEPVKIRVGIHSGPVVSGVVGTRMPRFCLFGDTINTASRMESTGTPGCIHVSSDMHSLLSPDSRAAGADGAAGGSGWAPSGGVEVKGKGMMETFLWTPPGPSGR
ncbi:hypothetical protein HXX76_008778 [Chlamydomonas incerta]|uniref:Guanylate cyclase domain-containing protein n=1 Tax=Chlamydomonas incerta TaxID=51695 RepID=A0A835SWG6_CHLIN|nr:hypothetical protein HXX76_008778 [Chlamydomonas incerta]|eukprot:KAG2433051.1 hypothetical protein HXX76_008778 [Chlamydomonas incerta]